MVYDDLMGIEEVAEHLGVQRSTVYTWRFRGVMVAPDLHRSGTDLWLQATIDRWAAATGRMPAEGEEAAVG